MNHYHLPAVELMGEGAGTGSESTGASLASIIVVPPRLFRIFGRADNKAKKKKKEKKKKKKKKKVEEEVEEEDDVVGVKNSQGISTEGILIIVITLLVLLIIGSSVFLYKRRKRRIRLKEERRLQAEGEGSDVLEAPRRNPNIELDPDGQAYDVKLV